MRCNAIVKFCDDKSNHAHINTVRTAMGLLSYVH